MQRGPAVAGRAASYLGSGGGRGIFASNGSMKDAPHPGVTTDVVVSAFEVMGHYLLEREVLGEIAVYGGTAIMLQFGWRRATEAVDAVIRANERDGAIKDAVIYAALRLGLPDDWLNNYVGSFTPEAEAETFFSIYGSYPRDLTPSLRVLVARPEYICAMKLKALQRDGVGDRDFNDAVALATAVGISTTDQLAHLFASFFPDERLDPVAAARLPALADAVQAGSSR
jgi:hypothetical protein